MARAGSVALLLPLALAAGAGFTAALGGGRPLRAIGQIVAGPSAPAARNLRLPSLGRGSRTLVLVPVQSRLPTGSGPVVSATSSPLRSPVASAAPAPAGGQPRPSGARTPAPRPPSATGAPAPSAPSGSTPSPSAPAPAPEPVAAAGGQVAGAAGQLPAPVGPAAGDAAQAVVDMIVPPPGR